MNKPIATLQIEKVNNGFIVIDGKEKYYTENIQQEAQKIADAIVEHAQNVERTCEYRLHYKETRL